MVFSGFLQFSCGFLVASVTHYRQTGGTAPCHASGGAGGHLSRVRLFRRAPGRVLGGDVIPGGDYEWLMAMACSGWFDRVVGVLSWLIRFIIVTDGK